MTGVDDAVQDFPPQNLPPRRFGRRRLLQAGLGLGGIALAEGWFGGGPAVAGAAPTPFVFPDWARYARLADAGFNEDADPVLDMKPIVDTLKAQNVSVIELDTILSNWLTDAQFTTHLGKIKSFVDVAHAAGIRVVTYYPSLEVISVGGEKGPSFYKNGDGAAWVQRSIDGKPNVFYGSLVVWVDPGDESCWVSPNSPWRDVYLSRIKQLAGTGVDGIWPDVPIYFDGAAAWCDTSSWAAAAFKADSGLALPVAANFTDPTFRRFLEWRYRNLLQWQLDITAAGRSVNPNLVTFVETVSMDYKYATQIGLDGGYLRTAPDVSHVWEVDILGNYDGMRHATVSDWACLISMYKYARAASGTKPAWAFSYGWQADDAALVMAEVLAAGCNPYEVRTPFKTAGVDPAMRTRMYDFVRLNQARLFDARSTAQVGLYHSSASRDYVPVPSGTGSGMYVSTTTPAGVTDWWSKAGPEESCTRQPWLGEFRGTVKALVLAQIPFDTVPSPGLTAADLARFRCVLLPNLQAVSDAEAAVLRGYVAAGGTVVITGPAPTALDQLGAARTEYALADVLGFRRADPQPASARNSYGSGTCWYFQDLPGLAHLTTGDQAAADRLLTPVRQAAPASVTVSGDRRIHLETRQLGADTVLNLVNFSAFGDTQAAFRTTPTTCTVSVAVPAGKQVVAVTVSSPDNTTSDPRPVAYTVSGGAVSFTLTLVQYSLVSVTMQ